MMKFVARIAGPLVALGVSASAQAADFSYSDAYLSVVGNLSAVVGAGSGLGFTTGDASKAYVTTDSNSSGYNSFGGGSYLTVLGGGSATFQTALGKTFSLLWGTVDKSTGWNSISFYNGNALVASFDGSLISAALDAHAAYLTQFTTAAMFNKVVLTANQNSFEVANVAAVPGPIAGAGLPAVLGLMGFAAWRRRQARA